jgi:transposase
MAVARSPPIFDPAKSQLLRPMAKAERLSPIRSLPLHLHRIEQRIEPEAGNCTCPDCGGVLRPLGEDRFDHRLPLYRQAEMMAAQGLDIDRSTLANWAGQAAHLLDPIVSRICEEGFKAAKIHTDDTPVPMLVPGKGNTAQARPWNLCY